MKIFLVALNAKYVHSNLAVYDLKGYFDNAKKKDDNLKNVNVEVGEYTINHNMDYILSGIYKEKADIYAFSCYIWNIKEVLELTNELAKINPYAKIWLGGPEASYGAVKYLEENSKIEGVMIGEGEATLVELARIWNECKNEVNKDCEIQGITDCESQDRYKGVLGIAYRNEGVVVNRGRDPINMNDIPFIYGEVGHKEIDDAESTLVDNNLDKFENKIIYYESSRGCPFSCSYCLSSIDKRVRLRSLSLVKEELKFFIDNKVSQVKFVDRTFNCNKNHAREIWKFISANDNGITNFHFEIAADLIEDEDIEIFKGMRQGLIQLEIGLQSTNLETVKEIRRTMDIKKVKNVLLKVRALNNIHQHLDLIAGLPYEDYETFKKSFNDAMSMKPHQLQLGFLKVLKGSYMGEMIDEYEIKYRDIQPFEVLSTKWISYDEIMFLKKVEEMVEVYYNSDQFEHVLTYVIGFFNTPFDFYNTLGNFYEDNDLFGIGFKREARYVALKNFVESVFDLLMKVHDIFSNYKENYEFIRFYFLT